MFDTKLLAKKIFVIVIAVFLVFFAQLSLPILFDLQYDSRFTYLIIGIVLYFSLINTTKIDYLARNAFFFIAIFGTVIALVRPVQYALDEESHLKNAIGLSDSFLFKYSEEELKDYEAVFVHDGLRNAPNYQGEDYWNNLEHQESIVTGEPIGFDNPAFLPSALTWTFGELISNKVEVSYYLGRIGTVLAYAVLVFLAIKTSLVYKEGIYLLGTMPSALYVTAGFHYDYLYYGASLLIIAHLTNILSGRQELTLKKTILMQSLAFLLVFAKFPYVLLATLPIFIPKKHYSDKQVKPFAVVNFLLIMLIAVVYSGIINVFKTSTFVSGDSPGLSYFLQHPMPIIKTLLDAPVVIVHNFIGRPLQYVSHDSGLMMTINLVLFLVLYLIIAVKSRLRLQKGFQVFMIGLMLAISTLIIYAITGDPRVYTKGDILVGGVQGRYYFFPLAIFPIFLGDWLRRWFRIGQLSDADEQTFASVLQYVQSFLMLLTISVALYTQL